MPIPFLIGAATATATAALVAGLSASKRVVEIKQTTESIENGVRALANAPHKSSTMVVKGARSI
ncbi:hypothetical protein [uncultured Selenomonas sp.]|uniref:hypothetical protein n=1 Tax=uncultured Selenomonas sp. TaxID=159275 RepID=UPI0028DC602A|nr:hypothetical protein [uncultured Selenomonas sp.]